MKFRIFGFNWIEETWGLQQKFVADRRFALKKKILIDHLWIEKKRPLSSMILIGFGNCWKSFLFSSYYESNNQLNSFLIAEHINSNQEWLSLFFNSFFVTFFVQFLEIPVCLFVLFFVSFCFFSKLFKT